MESLQIGKSKFSPFLGFRSDLRWKSCCVDSYFNSSERVLKLQSRIRFNLCIKVLGFRVCCRVRENDGENKREEPTESLFMKELRKRGMNTTTSLLEGNAKEPVYEPNEETKQKEYERGFSKRNSSLNFEIDRDANQSETSSMAFNSEELEGLVPLPKLLLSLGGTFFSRFWILILTAFGIFTALYLFCGSSFIHN